MMLAFVCNLHPTIVTHTIVRVLTTTALSLRLCCCLLLGEGDYPGSWIVWSRAAGAASAGTGIQL